MDDKLDGGWVGVPSGREIPRSPGNGCGALLLAGSLLYIMAGG
jgi:hypothetical protein